MLGLGLIIRAGQRVLGGLSALLKALIERATYSENKKDSDAVVKAIEDAGVLDDATILLTPTAYSNTIVHSTKTYTGTNLITYSDLYSTSSSLDDSSGKWVFDDTANATLMLGVADRWTAKLGNIYKVSVTISNLTGVGSNDAYFRLQSSTASAYLFNYTSFGEGTTEFYTVVGGTADALIERITISANGKGFTLEDITVIDVTSDFAFDRASSATRINSNANIEDITSDLARINYDSNGANGHILLEPTSTNFLPYSNDFSQSNWVKQTNITPTYNTTETLSPDGTYNATKLVGNGTDGIYDSSLSITGDVTRSVYLKSVSGTINVKLKDSNVDIGTETLTVTTEWQRFYLSGDNGTSSQGIWIDDIPLSGIYIFGAQVENLPYATSYIPTLTGSTVTRAAETLTGSGNSTLINSTEGVLYVEALMQDTGTFKTAARITATDTSITDGMWIYFKSDNRIQSVLRVGGVDQVGIQSSVKTTNEYYKVAFKFKQNDFALWIDGTEVATDTSGNTFSAGTLSKVGFVLGTNTNPFYGKVKALAVFDRALTDQELTDLTT